MRQAGAAAVACSAARVSSAAASCAASSATATGWSPGASARSCSRVDTPGEHEDAARAEGVRGREVGEDPVADHDRLARIAPDRVGRDLEQPRGGFADRDRRDACRRLDRGDDRAGSRPQAALGRVDRVAVRRDEPGAGTDAVGGGGKPQVGQVRIESDEDGIRLAGRGVPVDPLLLHPRRGVRRGHHLQPDVPGLPFEPAGAQHQDPSDRRILLGEVEGGGPGRRDHGVGGDRGAHAREAGHVVGPVVHRVVRDVDHVVAGSSPGGEDLGHAWDGLGAAVHHAVEVDEQEEAHPRDGSRHLGIGRSGPYAGGHGAGGAPYRNGDLPVLGHGGLDPARPGPRPGGLHRGPRASQRGPSRGVRPARRDGTRHAG